MGGGTFVKGSRQCQSSRSRREREREITKLTDTSHEDTTLTVEVRVDLLLERRLVRVTGSDGDGERARLLHGLASHVLPDGDRRVDSAALLEQGADGAARTLGRAEDDVDVLGSLDSGVLGVHERESVREVKSLAFSLPGFRNQNVSSFPFSFSGETIEMAHDEGLDVLPGLRLGGVREEVHDDRTAVDRLVDGEEGLSGDPSVLLGLLPRLSSLADTDDDVDTVVASVESLSVTLGSVPDESERVVLEVFLEFGEGPVCQRGAWFV